jgi:putative nucleotidyltransferase with HDIG domain
VNPSRADAWATVCEFTPGDSLRRHMLAVEAAMRAYARRYGADEEVWGVTGLLHDFDYETFPDEHPQAGERILAMRGWPEEIRRAVLSHAEHAGVPRITTMEKALHACDEITGLVVAVALVRPDRDLRQVKASSVRKKWKDRSFAGGVDRDAIEAAVAELGVPLDEHIEVVLSAMQGDAEALGLAGAD